MSNTNKTTPLLGSLSVFAWEPENQLEAESLMNVNGMRSILCERVSDEEFGETIELLLTPILESDTGFSFLESEYLTATILSGNRLKTIYHVLRLVLRHTEIINGVNSDDGVICDGNVKEVCGSECSIYTIKQLTDALSEEEEDLRLEDLTLQILLKCKKASTHL